MLRDLDPELIIGSFIVDTDVHMSHNTEMYMYIINGFLVSSCCLHIFKKAKVIIYQNLTTCTSPNELFEEKIYGGGKVPKEKIMCIFDDN